MSMIQIHCAYCGEPFEKDVNPPYGTVECPHCQESFDLASRVTVPYGEKEGQGPEGWPGKKFGGYRIVREIGRGGMGIVYEAVQESLERKVAVKVLFRDSCKDPQFIARFEREAESLARLSHPNIVNILDRGVEDDLYFFVMEYVDGVSLRALLDEDHIDTKEALKIIPSLCDALEYAHEQGVIHRDIKPGNILIDRQGRVKIADFGLSRILRGDEHESRITRSNMVMGTPDYMAPEQRTASKEVDHRADIYALGVVFYEMLTGELPVGHFPPPSKKRLEIDVRLDEIVLKVLDKDPALRYQRASEIATDLLRIDGKAFPKSAPVPAWRPATGREEKRPAGSGPDGKRTFLDILEDGYDSWVLVVAIILTIIDPIPMGLLMVGWIAFRRKALQHRAERCGLRRPVEVRPRPAGNGRAPQRPNPGSPPQPVEVKRPAGGVPPAPPAPPAPPRPASPRPADVNMMSFLQAQAALGVPEGELQAMSKRGRLKGFPDGQGNVEFRASDVARIIRENSIETVSREPSPRTSIFATLSAFFSMTLVLAFLAFYLPFEGMVRAEFLKTPLSMMPVVLSIATLAALPGLIGLVWALVAKTRCGVHAHLGGTFLALLGLAGSVVFLGLVSREWYDHFQLYRHWASVEEKAERGDAQTVKSLMDSARDPRQRALTLDVARRLPAPAGSDFFEWATSQEPELARPALRSWAKSERLMADADGRRMLLVQIDTTLQNPDPSLRSAAVEALGELRGSEVADRLKEKIDDPDVGVRRHVADAIRAWSDARLVDPALTLALDASESVADRGVSALEASLREQAPTAAMAVWVKVLSASPHEDVRCRAINRLRTLVQRGEPLSDEARGLLMRLNAGKSRTAHSAASLLKREGFEKEQQHEKHKTGRERR